MVCFFQVIPKTTQFYCIWPKVARPLSPKQVQTHWNVLQFLRTCWQGSAFKPICSNLVAEKPANAFIKCGCESSPNSLFCRVWILTVTLLANFAQWVWKNAGNAMSFIMLYFWNTTSKHILVFANGAIYDPMAKCKFHVVVMKTLRHMWVGWGWGGALITFLLMLRNSQLYAATAADKVRNMWWKCYATCGLGGDNVPVDAAQLTALLSNRRGQGMQHVMKMLHHMWVGWGWGGALTTFLLTLRNSQLYAATAGDKVRNMGWRCYATCGLGGDGVGHW